MSRLSSVAAVFVLALVVSFGVFHTRVLAEDKNIPSGIIPKLPKTANDPELFNSNVYPPWGPVCQRYTYSVIYRDKEGRKPEYVKIYFNGKMIETQKADPNDNDYQKGVRYFYKYVPNKLGSNFYYFEASNGLGKTRAGIIDSPDNGPVLFRSAFDKNEIAVIDPSANSGQGKKILKFSTGKEWVGGIALSDDGRYLAAKTFKHVYLFDTTKPEKPLWQFNCEECGESKGGVDISGDGSKVIAALGEVVVAFNRTSSNPIWKYNTNNAYNVAISRDGKYMAAATMGEESNPNSNLLILWNSQSGKPLWQYHASGNFHDVSLSSDGRFIAGSTGCPDRRFYLFSRDSNNPLIRSEPLTRDSPVHQAKISADGSAIAVSSESDGGAVFLFNKNSKMPVWKFPTIGGSSVRALSFTPDGRYVGAATFGGQVYIFDHQSNQPIASWQINNIALGGVDIADDGSFIAVGGTDNKLHLFDRDKKEGTEILFDEYLEEIDISANGKYVAAGTGGSVYFFETFDKDTTPVVCTTIVEPAVEEEREGSCGIGQKCEDGGVTPKAKTGIFARFVGFLKRLLGSKSLPAEPASGEAVCGNDLCEPSLGETRENCAKDCSGGD